MYIKLDFSATGIAAIIGFALMLIFAYFPKLRVWFAGLASEVKSYIMLGLLLLTEGILILLIYLGAFPSIGPKGTFDLVQTVLIAFSLLTSNQPTHTLLPEAHDVKDAKAARVILPGQ